METDNEKIMETIDQESENYKDIYKYSQNRELSWLNFNRRVLEEALDENVPLFERTSFISIFVNNLDEFYMVRVGSLNDISLLKEKTIDNKTGMTVEEQLSAIYEKTAKLFLEKDLIYENVMGKLKKFGVYDLEYKDLSKSDKKKVETYYNSVISPILSPQIIDSRHPFPFIDNKRLYIVYEFKNSDEKQFGLVAVPNSLPEYLILESENINYIRTENIIKELAAKSFGDVKLKNSHIINVIRNADITVEDDWADHDLDYRNYMKKILKKRTRLQAVRLNSDSELGSDLKKFLCKNLNIMENQVFVTKSPLLMDYIFKIGDYAKENGLENLFYKTYTPRKSPMLDMDKPLLDQILKKDVLLIYPYEDIGQFIKILQEAADDERVISIKITIYRLSKNSKIVQSLVRAAENGKEVTAVMELQARFDEENNINYSDLLFESGCNIVYGVTGYKVHSKICQITLKDGEEIKHITQIGTGNYNEKTSKQYTDLSFITSDEKIGIDGVEFFKNINIGNVNGIYDELIVSPVSFKQKIMELIDEEIKKKENGRLFFKFNSLTDKDLIIKLAEASSKGVKIKLIIRGISCLIPGIAGYTENIEIRSIVGRYLEHPRIYKFGDENPKIYIGSADLMTRNTERRVEIAVPIHDEKIKQKINDYLDMQWKDNVKSRKINTDGEYEHFKIEPESEFLISQDEMMKKAIQEEKIFEDKKTKIEENSFLSFFKKLKDFFKK